MSGLFITATGTDIGKTFIAAGLVRQLRQAGHRVDAIKPIISGFDPAEAAGSDAGVLLNALGRPINAEEIARISPWRYRAPLAPDMAAKRESARIDFDAIVDFCKQAKGNSDTLLIEGVGGVMVPLDDKRTVLDWMKALDVPLILVAGSYLGTMSHTLTALDALARRGLQVLSIVVSESTQSSVPLAETAQAIARFAAPVGVLSVPRLAPGAPKHPAFARLATLVASG